MERSGVEAARDYLRDYFADEDGGWLDDPPPELPEWFEVLADHVDALPLDDLRLARAGAYLAPFLNDDPEAMGAMYYGGEAVGYLESEWGGDVDAFLSGFISALERDHGEWERGAFRDPPS